MPVNLPDGWYQPTLRNGQPVGLGVFHLFKGGKSRCYDWVLQYGFLYGGKTPDEKARLCKTCVKRSA